MRTLSGMLLILMTTVIPVSASDASPGQGGATPLNTREAETLVLMREDEKLARDVYRVLYMYWQQDTWLKAMQQRQARMNSIGLLLEQYDLPDPLPDNRPGSFPSPESGNLYTQLVARGRLSHVDAIDVGIEIEKIDITDLLAALHESHHETLDQAYRTMLDSSRQTLNEMSALRQVIARR